MRRRIRALKLMLMLMLMLVLVLVLSSTVGVGSARAAEGVKKKIYKEKESHRFAGAQLKGRLKKPDLTYIYQRKGLRAERIVNVPENFNDEILAGAQQF